jgi:hypothetical protein
VLFELPAEILAFGETSSPANLLNTTDQAASFDVPDGSLMKGSFFRRGPPGFLLRV